jgi:hypothetical protein
MKLAVYQLVLMHAFKVQIPPIGTVFWVNNLSQKFITNEGQHIVFRKG